VLEGAERSVDNALVEDPWESHAVVQEQGSMKTALTILTLLAVVAAAPVLCGCKPKETGNILEPIKEKDYWRPIPPGQLALRKLTDPNDIPDFTPACEYTGGIRTAIEGSLRYLSKPSSRTFFPYGEITHDHAVASLKALEDVLDRGLPPALMNAAIRAKFDVYTSIGWDGSGTLLFTGYYTPILDGSLTATEKFRYPLYKQPPTLVKRPEGQISGMKQPDGTIVDFPARREIEMSNMLAGQELVWLGDPFEVYIAHVQGSAKIRLPDGKLIDVGYTATSGHEYKSVAKEMIKDGKMSKENLSLRAMIDYFRAHSNEVNEYCWRNPRYIFFAETQGGPYGCLNEPVISYRTIATDKSIYPRACPGFVSAVLPRRAGGKVEDLPFRHFVLDQDAGGAIRAPGRCDLYVGVGDEAGELAGRTYREGRLYYLFLKPTFLTPPVLPAMTQPTQPTTSVIP
jgi:membrane-bound lytic murein transglycosylase A